MPGERRSVRFDVVVRIPPSSFANTRLLNSLASKLPNFSQFVGEFDRRSIWGAINLEASNGGIFTQACGFILPLSSRAGRLTISYIICLYSSL